MRSTTKLSTILKFAGTILVFALVAVAFGYRSADSIPKTDTKPTPISVVDNTPPLPKKKVTGAACCKVSFSRSAMLSGKNANNITPPAK